MGFKFSSLVALLEDLERNRFRKAANASRSVHPDHAIIVRWFNRHDAKIRRSQDEGVAFLSCLFPERRPDRCFHMQETRLASVFGRAYSLGTARLKELRAWKEQSPADFPNCLASILAQTEIPTPQLGSEVTLEEINNAIDEIAANVKSSAPTLRASAKFSDPVDTLTPILLRLRSVEAKWLVRMLLKSYHPIQIPEAVTMQQFHFLLEDLLNIQNDFGAAMDTLNQAEITQLPKRVSKADANVLKPRLADHLVPRIGVMIKRQAYHKARSIKHCCQMASGKLMSVEQKYDGEYCQVHIDMSKVPSERIQTFSKSGRDSTQDRIRLHHAIEASVNLGSRSQQCMIRDRCILEGKLLISSRSTGTIQPFHKIRKHVQHGERFLNHEADSPVGLDEQVMIMYYDILLLDHSVLLERPLEERRRRLDRLITPTKGLAEIGIQHTVDFGSCTAPEHLRKIFASCITQRLEWFVVKSCKDPYFSSTSSIHGIKLKKDYICEMGDIADVLLVGARLDAKAKHDLGHGDLKWNSFYMACLENKSEVVRFDAKPRFRVIGEVSLMAQHEMEYLNMTGEILAMPFLQSSDRMDISMDAKHTKAPAVLFKRPFVVEILGSAYERAANATYWTLRHCRLHKLHGDRSITDTVSFDELQDMATTAQTATEDAISQEDREWAAKLERADPKSRYILDKSQSTTTTTSGKSPSSLALTSPTPLRAIPRGSSFAIWSEASKSPDAPNRLFDQESSPPLGIETQSTMKRRCNDEGDVLHRKKWRQSEPGKDGAAISNLDSSPLARSVAYTATASEARSGRTSLIKKAPPWCRPSSRAGPLSSSPFEPLAIFRSSLSKRSNPSSRTVNRPSLCAAGREPLKEVASSSTAHNAVGASRHPQNPNNQSEKQEENIKAGDPPPSQSNESTPTTHHLTQLPTPPSSASETYKQQGQPKQKEHQNVTGNNSAPTKAHRQHHRPPKPSHVPPEKAQPVQTALPSLLPTSILPPPPPPPPPPILLTPSLQFLATAAERNTLQAHLWSANTSFTTSFDHFISRVPFHAMTLALVDIMMDPVEIACTMHATMDRLLARNDEFPRKSRQEGRVVFLDWRMLETMNGGKDDWSALVDSRSWGLFAGCLKWECDDSDEGTEREVKVRDCFDWKEAVRLHVDGNN